jgi:hypothetical protein
LRVVHRDHERPSGREYPQRVQDPSRQHTRLRRQTIRLGKTSRKRLPGWFAQQGDLHGLPPWSRKRRKDLIGRAAEQIVKG